MSVAHRGVLRGPRSSGAHGNAQSTVPVPAVCARSLALSAPGMEGGLCALTTPSVRGKARIKGRAQNNQQQYTEMRSADALIEVRTYVPSFMLGRIMAQSLHLKSPHFAT